MADPELICARIILPEFGRCLERISPILPPNNPPIELATTNRAMRKAVLLWVKPVSSNHIGANDKADQGKEPVTPCATIIWKDEIFKTDLDSSTRSFTSDQNVFFGACLLSFVPLSEKCGSLAKRYTKTPTIMLISPTMWKEILQPGIPNTVIGAINTEKRPPIIEPTLPVSWSHPKAMPRLLSSVESATRDWIAGATSARPIPLNARDKATYNTMTSKFKLITISHIPTIA